MNYANKLKASIKSGLNERRADVLAMRQIKKDARTEAKTEYRKEYKKSTISQAKKKARMKAQRRAEGLKGAVKSIKAKLPDDKGTKQGFYAVGKSSGSSPFEIGRK